MRTLAAMLAGAFALVSAPTMSSANGDPSEEPREFVGVLEVTTEGVSDTVAEKFELSLEEGLKLHGFGVAKRAALEEALRDSDFIKGCQFGPCLREVFKVTDGKVRFVLLARIQGEGTSYRFLISLLNTESGAPTAQIPTGCTVCTVEEAIAAATLAVVELVAGTGEAAVLVPDGPTGGGLDDLKSRGANRSAIGITRATAYALVGIGVAAGAAATALFLSDHNDYGYAAGGAGVGFVAGGATLFVLSTRF